MIAAGVECDCTMETTMLSLLHACLRTNTSLTPEQIGQFVDFGFRIHWFMISSDNGCF